MLCVEHSHHQSPGRQIKSNAMFTYMQHFILILTCMHSIPSDTINVASAFLARHHNTNRSNYLAASPIFHIPPGILGPPAHLESLDIGQSVNAFRSMQRRNTSGTHDFRIQRLSHSPHIFLLSYVISFLQKNVPVYNVLQQRMEWYKRKQLARMTHRLGSIVKWLG